MLLCGNHLEFTRKLMDRHHTKQTEYFGSSLIHRARDKKQQNMSFHQHMERILNQNFAKNFHQIEQKYYQNITGRDHQRLLKNVEQIYRQPGEKKQMLGLLQKLGVVTKEEKGWQELLRRLKEYEDALDQIQKTMRRQEEKEQKRERAEQQLPSVQEISRSVIQDLRQEIRLERMRSGRL